MGECWSKARDEVIDEGVELAREGYTVGAVASSLTLQYFRGRDARAARRRLAEGIGKSFYERHSGMTKQAQRMSQMEGTLRREGWRPVFGEDGVSCYWRHQASGLSVNNMGGLFDSFTIATIRAYESALRGMLLEMAEERAHT